MRIGRTALALAACAAAVLLGLPAGAAAPPTPPHNVLIFVADGLRYGVVTPQTAPALAAVQRQGVDFRNSHSLFPTITTGNASVIATGHRQGDTGDFGNNDFLGTPALPSAGGDLVPFFEDNATLADANTRFGGNYLNETTLLAAARAAGFSTAAIGKLGPTSIQDVTARDGRSTIIIDDGTGTANGVPVHPEVTAAIAAAGLPAAAPKRGANGQQGDFKTRGTLTPNTIQLDWFAAVATDVVLPRFKTANKPFVLVFWSRDPDGTQHNQGDSLNALTPGINGPTTMAAIRNASEHLQRLRDALQRLGLDKTTDIFITADHGFSTVSKQSAGSAAAKLHYADTPTGFLPPGFLAIDLALTLDLPLYESTGKPLNPRQGEHPFRGSALLGADPKDPDIVIGAQGASDLIWFPKAQAKPAETKALAARVTAFLTAQDYTGALFVDDPLGPLPGALPLSAIALDGTAVTPRPAIMVAFRSYSTGCAKPDTCGVDVADANYQQGQGNHGGFGRADTRNFMAAVGPDFKTGFVDPAPVSNADIVPTLARILGLPFNGESHPGRTITEALPGGKPVQTRRLVSRSAVAPGGFVTVLRGQQVGSTPYFDTAGAPGRTLGAPAN